VERPLQVLRVRDHQHAGDGQGVVRLEVVVRVVAHQHAAPATLKVLDSRPGDGVALAPAEVHRGVDERVVSIRREAKRLAGPNFEEGVAHVRRET